MVEKRRRLKIIPNGFGENRSSSSCSERSSEPPNDGARCALHRVRTPTDRRCQKRTRRRYSRFESRRSPGHPSPEFPANERTLTCNRLIVRFCLRDFPASCRGNMRQLVGVWSSLLRPISARQTSVRRCLNAGSCGPCSSTAQCVEISLGSRRKNPCRPGQGGANDGVPSFLLLAG